MDELLQRVEVLFSRGVSFEAVEDEIEASDKPEEAKAAAWLYAWSFQSRGEAMYRARQAGMLLRPHGGSSGSE